LRGLWILSSSSWLFSLANAAGPNHIHPIQSIATNVMGSARATAVHRSVDRSRSARVCDRCVLFFFVWAAAAGWGPFIFCAPSIECSTHYHRHQPSQIDCALIGRGAGGRFAAFLVLAAGIALPRRALRSGRAQRVEAAVV
jgi:hypothetical protein